MNYWYARSPRNNSTSRGLLRGAGLRSEPLFGEQQSRPERYSQQKGRKTAKDWQLGRHTQYNKEVYRPARRDDRPTVPETTEAHCGGPQ